VAFRLPSRIPSSLGVEATGDPALELELRAEMAASLGRAGAKLEQALAALHADPDGEGSLALRQRAADALQAVLIQRELCGLRDHRRVMEDFAVPRAVVVRVGVC
jgi:hypothetical protein